MLCIFNGPLAKIEIRQPPEGMHFGADGFPKLSVKNVTKNAPGEQIKLGAALEIAFRGDEGLRVVDVPELANRLHKKLTESGGMDKNASFTSAEFGVQMTESPGRVEIAVGNKP
jgi:hypothetical protein